MSLVKRDTPIIGMSCLSVRAALDIDTEMKRQIDKFGEQDHEPKDWYLILGEEFGEVGKAILEKQWNYKNAKDNYREEMVQVAAVALSAIQNYDKRQRDGR